MPSLYHKSGAKNQKYQKTRTNVSIGTKVRVMKDSYEILRWPYMTFNDF